MGEMSERAPVEAEDSDADPDPEAIENWSRAREYLASTFSSLVLSMTANANLQVGMLGFHRAELFNVEWGPEFNQCFDGFKDNYQGKRRYDGPLHAEEAKHLHSGYGPLCIETTDLNKALPFTGKETTIEVLKLLQHNLNLWLGDPNVQGTCSCCAMVICNICCNVLYHHEALSRYEAGEEQEANLIPQNLSAWASTPRPQIGFVLPRITWRKGHRNHSLFDTVSTSFFKREKLAHASTFETKVLRLSMTVAYGPPVLVSEEQGLAWVRTCQNIGKGYMSYARTTSHAKKRGASQLLASSGASLPVRLALCRHENKEVGYCYLQQEVVEFEPYRQLLVNGVYSCEWLSILSRIKKYTPLPD